MAAELAVLELTDEDGLQENCHVLGARFINGLQRPPASHKLMGDMRGLGLMSNVLRVKPPMCITAADVDYALDAFDVAFRAVQNQ